MTSGFAVLAIFPQYQHDFDNKQQAAFNKTRRETVLECKRMYSYDDEFILKSRSYILVASLVNNTGIRLRETSEQTRFSRPTYFVEPTERNHHLSGAH